MSKAKYMLMGLVVGGTISAATALLTAPTSGRVVREKVKEQGVELVKVFDDIIKDSLKLKEQIAKTSKEGIALINELTLDVKTSVEDWKNSTGPNQDNIKKYLEQIETSIKELEEKVNTQKDSSEA